jgi:hypothetical protein
MTHSLNVESRRQSYGPNPHIHQHIKVSTLYTTHSSNSQNKWYDIKFDCVSSPVLVSFLYVPQEPSIHRASFTHFTLVLESIHTCQGREHSRSKRPVERSAVRSAPIHTPAHQSQYSLHDSLLQLLKTNCMISSSTVFQVRFWCRFCMSSCVQTHRHKNRHD